MGLNAFAVCFLGVVISLGISPTQSLQAQSNNHRASQQRREMERKRREWERRRELDKRKLKQPGRPKTGASKTDSRTYGSSKQNQLQKTQTRYVFRPGQKLAYSVQISASDKRKNRQWIGVILLATETPTPRHEDGSTHGKAKVALWGRVEGYYQLPGESEWHRDMREDMVFPKSATFATMEVEAHESMSDGCTRLPNDLSLCLCLLDGLFPKASLFVGNDTTQETREYFVETTVGSLGSAYHARLQGKAKVTRRSTRTTTTVQEHFTGATKGGSLKLTYSLQQTGTFHPAGVLVRSSTSFQIDGQGKKRVDIRVSQVSASEVIAAFSTAKP